MNQAERQARASPAARNYLLFSFAGLVAMVPVLLFMDMDLWCLFPLILGALSLLAHWRSGSVFVLLSLTVIVVLHARGYDPISVVQLLLQFGWPIVPSGMRPTPSLPFLDFLLAGCVLVYLSGHYRLQGLVHNIVPTDSRITARSGRVKGQRLVEDVNPRRVPKPMPSWEVIVLGVAVLSSAVAAQYVLHYLYGLRPTLGMPRALWRTIEAIWFGGLALFVAWAFFSYVGRCRATPEASLVYLQDQLWRQTRREQGRVNRWLAWARVRAAKRKEEGGR